MPAGMLGIEESDRAEIEAILARAKHFQPLQTQTCNYSTLIDTIHEVNSIW